MASSIVNSSQIAFWTFCENPKSDAHLKVHFGGFWAPELLTRLIQGGLMLESYIAGSYANFGSYSGPSGYPFPPPW